MQQFSEDALEAEGIVVDKVYTLMSGDGGRYKSDDIVEYVHRNGKIIRFTDHTALDFGVSIGDKVPVLYIPDDPAYARINLAEQDVNGEMISWLFIILALVCTLIVFFTSRKMIRLVKAAKPLDQQ